MDTNEKMPKLLSDELTVSKTEATEQRRRRDEANALAKKDLLLDAYETLAMLLDGTKIPLEDVKTCSVVASHANYADWDRAGVQTNINISISWVE